MRWSTFLGLPGYGDVYGVDASIEGSVYVVGAVTGAMDGEAGFGNEDIFVGKIDSAGSRVWTSLTGSNSSDRGKAIKVGTDGSIYVVGSTEGSFAGQSNNGKLDAVLIKYSQDGTKVWQKLLGSTEADSALALSLGPEGSIYVAGYTSGSFDGQTNAGGSLAALFNSRDAFLTKFSPDGTKIWTRFVGSSNIEDAYALSTGKDGSIYMAGNGFGSFDGQINRGGADTFITRFSPTGVKDWTRFLGGENGDLAKALVTGVDGSIYLTGTTSSTVFDGQTGLGGSDIFVSKIDVNGARLWTRLIGSQQNDYVSALSIGTDGAMYLAGSTSGSIGGQTSVRGDALLAKLGFDGTVAWVRLVGSDKDDSGSAVSVSPEGSVYMAGYSYGNYDGLVNNQFVDGFLTKFFIPDTSIPKASIAASNTRLIRGESTNITISLSKPSTDFTLSDLTISGGTVSNFSGYGSIYTAIFTAGLDAEKDGVIGISSGKFSDAAGNFNEDGADANNTVTITIAALVPQQGTAGADSLNGSNANDTIDGLAGNDTLTGGSGDDRLDGGAGIDQAIYTGTRSDYQLVKKADSNWAVTDQRVFAQVVGGQQGDGNDQVVSMERLKFSDKSIAIDLDGNAGNAARVLATILGKDAVKITTYAGIAISLFDQGMTKDQVSQVAIDAVLGANPKSTDVVKLLWKNLFNADIDAPNLTSFSGLIDSKAMTAAQLTTLAADLDLTAQLIDLAGLSKTGWEYVPFGT